MRPLIRILIAFAIAGTSACESAIAPPPVREKPAVLTAAATFGEAATVGSTPLVAPAVRVVTASGKPYHGAVVTFTVTRGGGTLSSTSASSDPDGIATAGTWTLGTLAGTNEVVATVAELPAARTAFTVTGRPDVPASLVINAQPGASALSCARLPVAPVVQLIDRFGNNADAAGIPVTASLTAGSDTIINGVVFTNGTGTATFDALIIGARAGTHTLRFSAPSLPGVVAAAPLTLTEPLVLEPGGIRRFAANQPAALACLNFDPALHAGQQFLVLFENMPLTGGFDTGIFPGTVNDTVLDVRLRTRSLAGGAIAALRSTIDTRIPEAATHAWDFGAGPVYEVEPIMPPGGAPQPLLLRDGALLELNSLTAAPQVGDTIVVRLEGLPRLGINTGNQRAVVRHISDELIIAEDARLSTLTRQNGVPNTPLSEFDMSEIAREYARYARGQGDAFFQSRFNTLIEVNTPRRVIAVHTLMFADNVWGYTYSSGDYFAFDFWVGTDGVTRGHSQNPQRVADNLFMHEIAHMRHWGMLQNNGLPPRGNRWLVEGFARFTERMPIAERLLGTTTPSRTANIVLPRNPAFGNTYFRDDVPTFLNAGSSMFGGYQSSSFVFDYFADQVALAGKDWQAAVRDFVINAGQQQTLDAAINRWLPGLSFAELFTRARIGLYTDDIGTALPAWTQYHQYQLRASRPPGAAAASDPRASWPILTPGTPVDVQINVANGAAQGIVIDGTQSHIATQYLLDLAATPNAVISITRIR